MVDNIRLIEKEQLKKDVPQFKSGDEIKVFIKMIEGGKIRVHPFEGVVLRRRGIGASATFTVRKVSSGEGIERTFFLNSPFIEKIEVDRKGKVKRSKIYYLRSRFGKSARIKEQK